MRLPNLFPVSSLVLLGSVGSLSATALAQTGVSAYGTGCVGGSGLQPSLTVDAVPQVQQQLLLRFHGIQLSPGLLVVGTSDTQWGASPLPLDLASFGFAGCNLLASPDLLLAFSTDAQGEALLSGPMPAAGGTLYFQALLIDIAGPILGGWSAGLAVTGQPAPSQGDVIVTEVMSNPAFTLQKDGEWFEVRNLTNDPINVEGWTLADDLGTHVIDVAGAGLVLAPQGTLVFGRKEDPLVTGGVLVDYTYGGALQLANDFDTVELRDYLGTSIDRVSYDDGATFPDVKGKAMSLDAYFYDATANDFGARWCPASQPIGGPQGNTDTGTPGADNPACTPEPSPGDVIVSEILYDPAFVLDQYGEYVELYNTTGAAIDVERWQLQDDGVTHVIDVGGQGLVLPAGGYLLVTRNGNPALSGGLSSDYTYKGALKLHNAQDFVALRSRSGSLVDTITYGITGFADPNGASISLSPGSLDHLLNDLGTNWCAATTAIGGPQGNTDLGTPGAANDSCAPPPLDITGTWSMTDTILTATGACAGDVGEITMFQMQITQTGTSLQILTPFGNFGGTLTGSDVDFTGSFPDDGGTFTFLSTDITATSTTLNGTFDWSWSDGFDSCTGHNSLEGTKL